MIGEWEDWEKQDPDNKPFSDLTQALIEKEYKEVELKSRFSE